MANHVSAAKRARQSEKRRLNNRTRKSEMRTAIKTVLVAVEAEDKNAADKALAEATILIDRAGRKGLIHSNQASRRVSRLTSKVKGLSA
ncbi:MAG: 30S ribosomal protein S20 [Mariprofundaceae bacterium]